MTALAERKVEFPKCPECGESSWWVYPESCGMQLGLNPDGTYYFDVDWVNGFQAECCSCCYDLEPDSHVEEQLLPYIPF
jgi:hypothetical protein